jgi:hypothetical protein
MNRAQFVTALAAATAAPQPRTEGIVAEVTVEQESTDLLAPFKVTIALRNSSKKILPVDFPTTDYYRIDIRHDDVIVFSTADLHKAIAIPRHLDAPPGITRLANQIIDGATYDKHAYAPGHYIVRVVMLGTKINATIDRAIEFTAPMPIARALKIAPGKVNTISGTVTVVSGAARLNDESGSIRLSHSLGLHPTGTYIVRGAIETLGTDVQFAIDRYAAAFDNTPDPKPTSS